MKLRFVSFLPAIAWFIVIFILLTIPGSDLPQSAFLEKIHFDKWVHIGLFSVLVFSFGYPCLRLPRLNSLLFWIMIAAILYGTAMEFVQKYFIPGRSFDVSDIAADTVGCIAGYALLRYLKKTKTEKA